MKTIELSTALQPLSAYAEEFSNEIVVLTLHGKAIAAVVSLQEVDPESLLLSMNPEFMQIIQQARDEFKAGKKLSLEEMKREIL
jgi:hypothetical protein